MQSVTGRNIGAANRSSLCEARQKLSPKVFSYLLSNLNQESEKVFRKERWLGHRVRAVDGTFLTLPCTEKIVKQYPIRENPQSATHYPYSLLVTATDIFTGIPKCARLVDHQGSERDQLLSMLGEFKAGDICVLDRGYDGIRVWRKFEELGQFYVARIKVGGHQSQVLKTFLESQQSTAVVQWVAKYNGEELSTTMRLVRQGVDRKGFPIVIGTNLLDLKKYSTRSLWKLYKKRWRVETMYGRIKEVLHLEKFHARTVNGIHQEIFANLFMLGMAAYLSLHAVYERKINTHYHEPNFKNAFEVLRRYLIYGMIDFKNIPSPQNLLEEMIEQIGRILCGKQHGRKNPRVSKQPYRRWNKHLGAANKPHNKWDKKLMNQA